MLFYKDKRKCSKCQEKSYKGEKKYNTYLAIVVSCWKIKKASTPLMLFLDFSLSPLHKRG